MSYEDFKTLYIATFKTMMEYSPNEVGSTIYAEKLADLADKYPAFTERVENEF